MLINMLYMTIVLLFTINKIKLDFIKNKNYDYHFIYYYF